MFDNQDNSNDNRNIHDKNEEYEVIRRDELEPINDPNCKHNFVVDSDEIGGFQAWVCTKCKRGTFLPKATIIINS